MVKPESRTNLEINGATRILLVEDNPLELELTKTAFEDIGSNVTLVVCQDGEEALAYLKGNEPFADSKKHPLPDLILLDLALPGISGNDVLVEIKKDKRLRLIPTIILTTSTEKKDILFSHEHHANSYVVKPFSYEQFLEVLREILRYWSNFHTGISNSCRKMLKV